MDQSKERRLELIKRRHRELILNPRQSMMSGWVEEEDDSFDSYDEHEDLSQYEQYADFEMEV